MDRRSGTLGPYRATKLWNDMISEFRMGLPLGRHRRYMKTYDDCFVSTDAVDWLFDHLNDHPEFGQVTRGQTVQLLQKFHKTRVFEDVRGDKYAKEQFTDNGKLYKFSHVSPVKTKSTRTPLASRTNIFNHHALEPIKLDTMNRGKIKRAVSLDQVSPCRQNRAPTQTDTEHIWRTMTLEKLQKVLCLISLDGIMDSQLVNPKHIIHNMTQLNKNGVVTNVPQEDQLPHWILSAMKVLANWPEQMEENLPKYPGFERDIFTVVTDYFTSLGEPLLTYQMYEVFTNVLVTAENVGKPKKRSPSVGSNSNISSFGESVENLLMNLTLRAKNFVHGKRLSLDAACTEDAIPEHVACHNANRSVESNGSYHSNNAHTPNLTPRESSYIDDVDLNPVGNESGGSGYHYQRTSPSLSNGHADDYDTHTLTRNTSSLRNGCKYASVQNLNSGGSPRGSIISEEQNNSFKLRCYSTSNVNEVPPFQQGILEPGQQYDSSSDVFTDNLNFLDNDKTNKSRHYGFAIALTSVAGDKTESPNSVANSNQHRIPPTPPPRTYRHRSPPPLPPRMQPPPYVPPPSYQSAIKSRPPSLMSLPSLSADSPCPYAIVNYSQQSDSIYYSAKSHQSSNPRSPRRAVNENNSNSQAGVRLGSRSSSSATISGSGSQSTDGDGRKIQVSELSAYSPATKARVNEALQLCMLLLPPGNKRKLYFLLRLMYKMCHNTQLHLQDKVSNRELVLDTFSRCIIRSQEEADFDEVLTRDLVATLIDNHLDIFKVPETLKLQIDERIAHFKVSLEEYERQRLSHSQTALGDLLEDIIKDKLLSSKDKKKKLKRFQKTYPDIYSKRFPTSESEAELFPNKPKIKQPLLARPLLRFRNIRL